MHGRLQTYSDFTQNPNSWDFGFVCILAVRFLGELGFFIQIFLDIRSYQIVYKCHTLVRMHTCMSKCLQMSHSGMHTCCGVLGWAWFFIRIYLNICSYRNVYKCHSLLYHTCILAVGSWVGLVGVSVSLSGRCVLSPHL